MRTFGPTLLVIAMLACGCEDDDNEPTAPGDASAATAGQDAGGMDSGRPDGGSSDAGGGDASSLDSGAVLDAGRDAGAGDAGAGDAGASDAGAGDAGGDAASSDASADAASGDAGATFARVYEIIMDNCTPCHVGMSRGNLDMGSSASAYGELVGDGGVAAQGGACSDAGITRVVAGDPDDSLLIQKLEADPPCGSRMPANDAGPLSEELIDEIRAWISAGALDN
jgi:hypothetical protein